MSLAKLLETLASWTQTLLERLAAGVDPEDDTLWPQLRDYPYREP